MSLSNAACFVAAGNVIIECYSTHWLTVMMKSASLNIKYCCRWRLENGRVSRTQYRQAHNYSRRSINSGVKLAALKMHYHQLRANILTRPRCPFFVVFVCVNSIISTSDLTTFHGAKNMWFYIFHAAIVVNRCHYYCQQQQCCCFYYSCYFLFCCEY